MPNPRSLPFEYVTRQPELYAKLLSDQTPEQQTAIQLAEQRDRDLEDYLKTINMGGTTVGSVVVMKQIVASITIPNGVGSNFAASSFIVPPSSSVDPSGRYIVVVDAHLTGFVTPVVTGSFYFDTYIELGGTLNDGIYFQSGGHVWIPSYPAGTIKYTTRAIAVAECSPGTTVFYNVQYRNGDGVASDSTDLTVFGTAALYSASLS